MNAKYPEGNTEESEEGTAAHWVMSELLAGRETAEGTLAPNGVAVTFEMIEGAELVRDTVRAQVSHVITLLHIEESVQIPHIHSDCFGTPDVWAVVGDRLVIVDYKYGHRYVDEYFNPQLISYMIGIMSNIPVYSAPKLVTFIIVQPRCYYRGEPVREHTFKPADALSVYQSLVWSAQAAYAPQPQATTGPQCEHCPGRHACPTLQRGAYDAAETSTDQQPVELSPEAAGRELRWLQRAKRVLDARVAGLEEQTLVNIQAGKRVPTHSTARGRGRLKWKVSPQEVIALGEVMGKSLSKSNPITPTQAKLYVDDAIISRYSEVVPGSLQLVEQSDMEATKRFREK